MPLWLIGMMGSGKSAVGQKLAAVTDSPFLDTDLLVEVEAGRSVSEVFAREGEAGFRLRESHAIEAAAVLGDAVVATGGGAVLVDGNVRSMKLSGPVVWLQADPATLAARIDDPSSRPLLKGDLLKGAETVELLAAMLEDRRSAYEAAADHVVPTDDASIEEVVLLLEELWKAS